MARVDSALRAGLSWTRNRSCVSNSHSRSVMAFKVRIYTRLILTGLSPVCRELNVSAIAVLLDILLNRDLYLAVFDDPLRM